MKPEEFVIIETIGKWNGEKETLFDIVDFAWSDNLNSVYDNFMFALKSTEKKLESKLHQLASFLLTFVLDILLTDSELYNLFADQNVDIIKSIIEIHNNKHKHAEKQTSDENGGGSMLFNGDLEKHNITDWLSDIYDIEINVVDTINQHATDNWTALRNFIKTEVFQEIELIEFL
eukprot:UN34374